ncbi:MAG: recombinase family protein [Bdellovibrionota bacterium]
MRNSKPDNHTSEPSSQKAVVYTRVSLKEQRDEGYSVEAQARLLRAYAQNRGFQIVKEFEDVETAKQSGRTQFGSMLEFFKQEAEGKSKERRCQILLVEKTDRLYRNFEDFVALDRLDLFVHLVKDGDVISRNSDASKKLMHAIRVSMSNWTVNNLGEEASKRGCSKRPNKGCTRPRRRSGT